MPEEGEGKGRRRKLMDDVESLADEVNKAVCVAVVRGSEAAESLGENIRDRIKDTLHGVRSARDSVVMVRVDKESLARLDDLVEAGIAGSRSEAAAFLIGEGTRARQGLFDRISGKIDQIRKTREELRLLLEEEEEEGRPAESQ